LDQISLRTYEESTQHTNTQKQIIGR
jgi:hypothetical protein